MNEIFLHRSALKSQFGTWIQCGLLSVGTLTLTGLDCPDAFGQATQEKQQEASVIVLSKQAGDNEKLLDELREKIKFLPEDQRKKILDQVEKSMAQATKNASKQQRVVVATVDAKGEENTKDGNVVTMTIVQSSEDDANNKKGDKQGAVTRIEKRHGIIKGNAIPEGLKSVLGNNLIIQGSPLIDAGQESKFRIGLSVKNAEGSTSENGLVVDQVMEGSPAAEAGITVGDVIVAINGQDAKDLGSLQEAVQEAGKAERSVKLKIDRDGKEQAVKIKPTKAENPIEMSLRIMPQVGGSVLPLNVVPGGEAQAFGFAIPSPQDHLEANKEIAELKKEVQELKQMVRKLLETIEKR